MNTSNTQKGFTLIEIIVSLGIFTVVAVVAVGAFLKVIDANKKSQTLKTAINNVNFALESISREMRVGSVYSCYDHFVSFSPLTPPDTITKHDCSDKDGDTVVYFKSSKGDGTGSCNLVYGYWFASTTIAKAEQSACGDLLDETHFAPVISKDALIDERFIEVVNQTGATGPQPKMFIRIKGHAGNKEKNKTYFDVQTTVSQRNPF